MNLAVTGVTGFIGGNLLLAALGRGWSVRALYRSPARIERFAGLPVDWVLGEMVNPDVWSRLLPGCKAVIHLAASGVADLTDVFAGISVNSVAIAHLLYACRASGVRRVVLAGSCFEYGRTGDRIGERGLRETDPLEPVNPYAGSKAAGTQIAQALAVTLGLEVAILRPFHVYGPLEPSNRLIPYVIRAARAGDVIRTTGGDLWRDLVHVHDVVEAFLLAATTPWPHGEPGVVVLNVGSGLAIRLRDLITDLVGWCGRDPSAIRFGELAYRPNEVRRYVADPSRCLELLGFRPRVKLREGLSEMITTV